MDLAALERQMDAWERRYQAWAEPINQAIYNGLYRVDSSGSAGEDPWENAHRVREQQLARDDPYQEIYALLDELCPAYLTATAQQRASIRAMASTRNGVLSALLGYVYRAAHRIQSPADREWLRRGLAAVSIENCSKDFRDVALALAELYVAAEQAGIPPRSDFRAIASLSSPEKPAGGTAPVRDMLTNFHNYGALRERKSQRQP
jgi:hypothetical protein